MPKKAAQPSLSEQRAAPGGVGAVDRAISLLDVFTPDRPLLSLAELAEESRQYKSTVLRLLASLAHSHLVVRHADGRFSLGSTIPRLHAVYAASFSLENLLLPALRELVEATRESAAYHIRQGAKRLCMYGVDSPQTIRDHTQVGALLPLGKGAAGAVFTAFGSAPFPRGGRIVREPLVIAPTDLVREVAAIAAPVFKASGALAGVIALTMPAMRLQRSHGADVLRVAGQLTAELGGRYPARN
ncbi:IclR family transcriptional regulator [soil metagenome]